MRDNKIIAAVSYITPLGWIIAFLLHRENPNHLSGFHLRQSLGLLLSSAAISFVQFVFLGVPILGALTVSLAGVLNLLILVAIIYSIVQAVNGKTTYLPILGDFFDVRFKNFIQP